MKEMSLTWEEKLTKTGQTQEDRRQALEKLGISVQSSGISVEKNKCYLVNLNSDPSLNEMLVYYLKNKTLGKIPKTTNAFTYVLNVFKCILKCISNIDKQGKGYKPITSMY